MEYRKLDDGKLLNVFSAGTMVSSRNTLGQVPRSLYGPGRRRMTPTRQFGITIVHDLSVHNQILVFDSNARNEP